MKIITIISFILLTSFGANCQELLNTKENYIIKTITGQNGKLILKRSTRDITTNTHGDMLIFSFTTAETEQTGLFQASFFFSPEGDCTHYLYRYSSYKSFTAVVNKLDTLRLYRKESNTLWVSKKNSRLSITVKKDLAFAQPPNFEVSYIQRPVNYVPYKSEIDDSMQKLFPGIKKQE